MHLALVASIHTMGVVAHCHGCTSLLLCWVWPVPVLASPQANVRRSTNRGLVGGTHGPIDLILSVALEVVLVLLQDPRGALLLVHGVCGPRRHGRAVLGLAPQVVIGHAALVVVVGHVWVR